MRVVDVSEVRRAQLRSLDSFPGVEVAQTQMTEAMCRSWFHDLQGRINQYGTDYDRIFDERTDPRIRRESAPSYFERGRQLMLEILRLLEQCGKFLDPKQVGIMEKNLKGLRKKLENIARDLPLFHGTPFEGLQLPNFDRIDLEPIFAPFRGWQRV